MIGESKVDETRSVVTIAHSIIQQAIRDNASEICIEPANLGLLASIKVGEEWQEVLALPDCMLGPVIERFKQMANVDLTCVNRSQEGRIPVQHAGKEYVIALRSAPTFIGEHVGMRFEA